MDLIDLIRYFRISQYMAESIQCDLCRLLCHFGIRQKLSETTPSFRSRRTCDCRLSVALRPAEFCAGIQRNTFSLHIRNSARMVYFRYFSGIVAFVEIHFYMGNPGVGTGNGFIGIWNAL